MMSCAEKAARGLCRDEPDSIKQCREACYNHALNLRRARQLLGTTDQMPPSVHVLVDTFKAALSNTIVATYGNVPCCSAYDAYDALLYHLHDVQGPLDVHPEAVEMAVELDAAAKLIFTDAALGDDWLEERSRHLQGAHTVQGEATPEYEPSLLYVALVALMVFLGLLAVQLTAHWRLRQRSGAKAAKA